MSEDTNPVHRLLVDLYPTTDERDELTKFAAAIDSLPVDVLGQLAEATVKTGARITTLGREKLKTKQFAIPEAATEHKGIVTKPKGKEKGRYPVDTIGRARSALSYVSQHGTPQEREMVRMKVYAKYPQLRKGYEKRHGVSPMEGSELKKQKLGADGYAYPQEKPWMAATEGKVADYLKANHMSPLYGMRNKKAEAVADIMLIAADIASDAPAEMAGSIIKTAASQINEIANANQEKVGTPAVMSDDTAKKTAAQVARVRALLQNMT